MSMHYRLMGFNSRNIGLPRPVKPHRAWAILSTIAMLCATGCSAEDKKMKASDDVMALQQLIDVPVNLKSARWEMFGTPEYHGGVPGRTDYMTLVAEIEPATNADSFTIGANDKSIYVVPEAARPWLSIQFRSILEKNRNANFDLSTAAGCHVYATTIKKSGRKVSGFSCEKSGNVLLYLSIF
jgi:hypothetical protein